MSFSKIWSNRHELLNLEADSEIKPGQRIFWHCAIFENLMTERAAMTACTWLSPEAEQGNFKFPNSNSHSTKWFLQARSCVLGEKSVWVLGGHSRKLTYFIEVFQVGNAWSQTFKKVTDAHHRTRACAEKSAMEIRELTGAGFREDQMPTQVCLAKWELYNIASIDYISHWLDDPSIAIQDWFGGDPLSIVNCRRGHNFSWSVVAYNKLGVWLRAITEENLLQPGGGVLEMIPFHATTHIPGA